MPLFEGISYGNEKNAVIFDIGTAYTKCGFSAEASPRFIIPSEVKKPKTKEVVQIHTYKDDQDLYSNLVDFFHVLYFKHLLVNPKDRRVVICESLLCPTIFRETLAKVLFKHYEVPSIVFAPTHLLAMFTLGCPSGLVMDVGNSETLVLPVYEGTPILKAWQAVPLGGKAIHSQIRKYVIENGKVRTKDAEEKPLSAVTSSVEDKVVEDIKVRCCFVTKLSRAQTIQQVALHTAQGGEKTAELPPPPPSVDYPLDGETILHIDGQLREHTCEVLFEQDNEEKSVATLILDSIIKCPIDMRSTLAENIVIMGGTSMLTGFKSRLSEELKDLIERPKYREELAVKEFKFHQPPSKENYTAWLGGAIFGSLEVLASRSIMKETYLEKPIIPDWSSLSEEIDSEKEEKPGLKR